MTLTANNQYDVVIVGAGPAGSSAAIRLALSGLSVALVEQKKFPRQKLCGEFISPECLDHFDELGVLDQIPLAGGVELNRTVFYAGNGRSAAVPSEWFGTGSDAVGLSRAAMDDALLNRVRTAGVNVLEATQATGLVIESGVVLGLHVRDSSGSDFEIRSPLTIDATGRSRILGRQIEKLNGTRNRRKADYVAFKTHLSGVSVPRGDCEIYAYRGGYGGCSEVENGRHNLCFIVKAEIAKRFGGDAARLMQEAVFKNKQAARSLKNANILEPWLAAPIESYGRYSLAPAHGLLAVGDAAAFIDPFTGSGILLALESSRIAERAITSNRGSSFADLADDYKKLHAAAFDRRLRICSVLRHAAFVPFLSESVIKLLALSGRVTRRVARATR